MAKEKKIVNIANEDESEEKFGKDSHGRIIKLEESGDPEKRAKTRRIFAVLLWIIAIAFEAIGILRLTGKKGFVQEMNYEELVKLPLLNTKSHIPLLKEVLELNHDQEYIDIEIKPTKNIYDTVFYLMKESNGYHKYVIKSFDPRIIRFIKKHYPDVSAGLLIQNQYDHFLEKAFLHSTLALIYSKCDFVALSKKIFKNKKLMKKYRGYPVLAWTIQDGEEINYQDSISYICNNLPYKNKKDS